MRAHFLCTELRLLLTAYSQLTGDIMQTNIEESDVPMVQVSEHWGARESHALWQGRIFTVEQFKAVCGYGEPSNPDHIYSYNCRHTHYPYWPGISEPIAYQREPGPFTINGRRYTYYEATQKQRAMERQIRALKREVNAGGDKATLGSEIRQRTREYKAFSDACGIREKLERLHVLGYDRSTVASVRTKMSAAQRAATLNTKDDPIRDHLGAGIVSHPQEVKKILESWDAKGVEYSYRSGVMAYTPGLSAGEKGRVVIDPDASIGAWRHENRHVLDDEANGWPGFRYYNTKAKMIRYEHRGYAEEIAIAGEIGSKDLMKKIRRLRRARDEQIHGQT